MKEKIKEIESCALTEIGAAADRDTIEKVRVKYLGRKGLVTELFKKCRNEGIHTCLETCGLTARENWAKILPETNLVFFDLKILDSQAHKKATGQPNEQILDNLKYIAAS